MIGIGWNKKKEGKEKPESQQKAGRAQVGDGSRRKKTERKKRRKRKNSAEGGAFAKARTALQSGKLTKADCDALVEGMKTGRREGVAVFRKVVSTFAMSRDLETRAILVEDVIFPFTATEGGFGCGAWDAKNADVFLDGQGALLDCWETLLETVEDFADQNHRIYSYKSILQIIFRDEFDIYQRGATESAAQRKDPNREDDVTLQTFSRFFRLCYRLHFHISEKLEDTTFKPSSAALHFFTEALAYLMLVLPSLPEVIIHGILLNYRRQEEQLLLLFQDPSIDCPEGLRIHQHVDNAPDVERDMRALLRANRRVSCLAFSKKISHSMEGDLKESHRLIDYWPTLHNLQTEIIKYDPTLHKLDAKLQSAEKFWVERLFRKKDLFYALLQKFVSQCGRLLRCEITEVDWGNVPVFDQLIRFFLIDMNNQSAAEYTALFLNTTKILAWCGALVSLFITYLFGATSVHRTAATVGAIQVVSIWLQGRTELPSNFNVSNFFEALSICLSSEHFDICFNSLSLLYDHDHLFTRQRRSFIFLNLFLDKFFWKFFLHWDSNLRATFQRILLYKISGALLFREEDSQTLDVLKEAQKKRDILIAQLQLQIGVTLISSLDPIMEELINNPNPKKTFELKSKKSESLVVPKDLNDLNNNDMGEEAEELEAMVGEVMKRNRTEKLEDISSSLASSEVASDEDEEEEVEEDVEDVEVSLSPDGLNLDLEVPDAQPVFRRQWSGVLPKMTDEEIKEISEKDIKDLVEHTPLQEKVSKMKGKCKIFPDHLEVYARQAIIQYQNQITEYNEWCAEQTRIKKEVLETEGGYIPNFPEVFIPPPVPEAEGDDDEDVPVRVVPAVVPPGALGTPPVQDLPPAPVDQQESSSSSFSSSSSSSSSSSPSSLPASASAPIVSSSSSENGKTMKKENSESLAPPSSSSGSSSPRHHPIDDYEESEFAEKPGFKKNTSKLKMGPETSSPKKKPQQRKMENSVNKMTEVPEMKGMRLANISQLGIRQSKADSLSCLIDEANKVNEKQQQGKSSKKKK